MYSERCFGYLFLSYDITNIDDDNDLAEYLNFLKQEVVFYEKCVIIFLDAQGAQFSGDKFDAIFKAFLNEVLVSTFPSTMLYFAVVSTSSVASNSFKNVRIDIKHDRNGKDRTSRFFDLTGKKLSGSDELDYIKQHAALAIEGKRLQALISYYISKMICFGAMTIFILMDFIVSFTRVHTPSSLWMYILYFSILGLVYLFHRFSFCSVVKWRRALRKNRERISVINKAIG